MPRKQTPLISEEDRAKFHAEANRLGIPVQQLVEILVEGERDYLEEAIARRKRELAEQESSEH